MGSHTDIFGVVSSLHPSFPKPPSFLPKRVWSYSCSLKAAGIFRAPLPVLSPSLAAAALECWNAQGCAKIASWARARRFLRDGHQDRALALATLVGDELFGMQDLLSPSSGNGKSRIRSRALLLPGTSALPTVWIYPEQTCQGKSWLYLKSH